MFIPQRPYFPEGSLRDALAYPEPASRYSNEQFSKALNDAKLSKLNARLDEHNVWNAVLSGGEQQRLAIARVLLKRPAWVFADEATSAMDNPTEAHVYQQLMGLIDERKGGMVSIAHRDSVQAFHNQRWTLDPEHKRIDATAV